jgi:hypothetical protein
MIFLAAAHVLFGLGLLAAGAAGVVGWWSAPEGEASLAGFLTSLLILPGSALFTWTGWNLWRLEGRGRLVALFLDAALVLLSAYVLLNGNRLAFLGVIPLFAVIYLSRSSAADRFW